MNKRIPCIPLAGVLICITLTAGFAKDAASRIIATDRNAGAADSIEGSEGEGYKQTPEELWIDEWGSVWIGGELIPSYQGVSLRF